MNDRIEAQISKIDETYNVDGRSWHVFGVEQESGYTLVDCGCAGNWYRKGYLADNIREGIERYGIMEYTIYYEERYADLKNMEKVRVTIK